MLLLLFSHKVIIDSFQPHRLQHDRLPCPSPSPGVYSDSSQLGRRCQATISPSVTPFSSCPQSSPASGSFWMSCSFTSGGQRLGALASALPMNTGAWLSLGLTALVSFLSKKLSRVFKHHSLALNFLYDRALTFIHDYWKKNSFDHTNLWWQSDGSTFL